jgi:hypothetical protein
VASFAHGPYRSEQGTTLIEIELREPRQLFNSLDPSPFHERDLDAQAESYLLGAVRELRGRQRLRLVIHLPKAQLDSDDARAAPEAIAHYFQYRAAETAQQLRHLLGNGAVSLAIGLAFLLGCLLGRQWVPRAMSDDLRGVIAEGLLIIGWVALWRPLEIFLYDWWPLWRLRREQLRLAQLPVEIRSYQRPPPPPP